MSEYFNQIIYGVKSFITGNVLSRYGFLIGLLILPLFLVAGSISILLVPMLMSASFAKFSDQTFKFTINNSSLELLWLPVHPTTRKTLKTFRSFFSHRNIE